MTRMQSNEINSKLCMKPKPRSNPKSKIGPIMGIRNKWRLIQLQLPNKADKPALNKGQLNNDRIIGGKFLPPRATHPRIQKHQLQVETQSRGLQENIAQKRSP